MWEPFVPISQDTCLIDYLFSIYFAVDKAQGCAPFKPGQSSIDLNVSLDKLCWAFFPDSKAARIDIGSISIWRL